MNDLIAADIYRILFVETVLPKFLHLYLSRLPKECPRQLRAIHCANVRMGSPSSAQDSQTGKWPGHLDRRFTGVSGTDHSP